MKIEEISQFVVENRFNTQITDVELFNEIKDKIKIYLEQELDDVIEECEAAFNDYHIISKILYILKLKVQ